MKGAANHIKVNKVSEAEMVGKLCVLLSIVSCMAPHASASVISRGGCAPLRSAPVLVAAELVVASSISNGNFMGEARMLV